MQTRWLTFSVFTFVFALQACTGLRESNDIVAPLEQTPETVIGMLDKHLAELSRNIARLDDRMAELKQMPDTPDPTIRELRALDLAGWELHQQQWNLQREHLTFARAQLRRTTGSPGDRARIREEWAKHEQEFEATMVGFRQQRHALEQKRLQVEAQLIDLFLR